MVRTPLRPQFQTTECGVAVLRIIFAHFGFEPTTAEIRRVSGVSRDCVSAADLRRAAQAFGFDCKALTVEPAVLRAMTLPVIVHLNFIHFVVLEAVEGDHVRLNCPAAGRIALGSRQFDAAFTGIALAISPTATSPRSAREWVGERAWWRWVVSRPPAGLAAALRSRIVARLQELPLSFYGYRLPEVLHALVLGAPAMAKGIHRRIVPAMLGVAGAIVVICCMAPRHASVAAAFLAICVVWLGWVWRCSIWRQEWDHGHGGEPGLAGLVFAALARPQATKLAGGPDRQWRLMIGASGRRSVATFKVASATEALRVAPTLLLAGLLAVLVPLVHAASMDGATLVAAAGAITLLFEPVTRLRGVVAALRTEAFHWRDVMEEPHGAALPAAMSPPSVALLMEDVAFAFSPTKPPVVSNVNLRVMAGEQVALVGPSGAGKSTLTKLIVGIYQPDMGHIAVVAPLSDARTCPILRVDRSTTFFAGSIRDNLTLGNERITPADLDAAIADTGLGPILEARAGGLDAPIDADGGNFSGGQLQRLEIARALVRNPSILILDDALDALDIAAELDVRAALRRRGCALLLISHRASSIAACDRVVKLRDVGAAARARSGREGVDFPLIAGRVAAGTPEMVGAHGAALRAALYGLLPSPTRLTAQDLSTQSLGDALAAIAKAQEHRLQRLDVAEPSWWRADFGKVLAFRLDGTPIALDTGLLRADERRSAPETLRAEAYAFRPRYAGPLRTIADWARCVTEGGRREAARACAAAAGSAAVLVALAAGLRSPITPLRVAALVVLSCCHVVFLIFRLRAARRWENVVAAGSADGSATLLARLRGDVLLHLSPMRAMSGLEGLDGVGRGLTGIVGKVVPAMMTLIAGLTALTLWTGSALIGPVLLALAGLALSRPAAAAVTAGAWRREPGAGLAARRHLGVLLRGIARLRLLGAEARAWTDWIALDQVWRDALRRKQAMSVIVTVAQAAGTVALVAWLARGGSTPLDRIVLGGIGWTLARASLSIGAFVSDMVDDRRRFLDAAALMRDAEPAGGVRVAGSWAAISVCNVSVRYRNCRDLALDDVSIEVEPGRLTVLAGPSGGGKSTLLRVMLGLQRVEAGTVRVGGRLIGGIDAADWRRSVAGVFQGDVLEDTVTIRGQLSSGSSYTLADIWSVLEAVELADEIRAMPMGLQTIVEAGSLSTGQQQRLMVAGALLHQPSLLILDEATNAIPDAVQARIVAHVLRLGIGCVAVTHRETMIDLADHVYLLEAGRIVGSDKTGNVAVVRSKIMT